jgi:hypothetical protein
MQAYLQDTCSPSFRTHIPELTVRVYMLNPGRVFRRVVLAADHFVVTCRFFPDALACAMQGGSLKSISRRAHSEAKHTWLRGSYVIGYTSNGYLDESVTRTTHRQARRRVEVCSVSETMWLVTWCRACVVKSHTHQDVVHPSTILFFHNRKTGRRHNPYGSILVFTFSSFIVRCPCFLTLSYVAYGFGDAD